MNKISRLSLSELEVVIPCFENDALRDVVGGGSGTYADPFTSAQVDAMIYNGTWTGGFVDGIGWVGGSTTIYGYNIPGTTTVYNYGSTPVDYLLGKFDKAIDQAISQWVNNLIPCIGGYSQAVTNQLVANMYSMNIPPNTSIRVVKTTDNSDQINELGTITIYNANTGVKITSFHMTVSNCAKFCSTGSL